MKVKVNGSWVEVPAFKVETGVQLEDVKMMIEGGASVVNIPEGITKLREQFFTRYNYNTSINFSVTFPSTLETIDNQCFYNNPKLIGKIYLPPNITFVGQYVFNSTRIEEVEWDAKYGIVQQYSFNSNPSLKRVVFNVNIKAINNQVFANDTNLELVDLSKCTRVPTLNFVGAFTNVPTTCTIKIPSALYDAWTKATNWATLVAQGYNFVAV